MNGNNGRSHVGNWVLFGCIVVLMGCQQPLQLPAIDPTGQRIFLPAPAATTLANPADSQSRGLGFIPKPAWQEATTPPPCPEPPPAAPPGARTPLTPKPPARPSAVPRGVPGKLSVTPARMIAPVGSEVVLLAGLCGDDGYLITQQSIEWNLSQDSVGQLVDYNDRGKIWTRAKKLSADYAITRTSCRPETVTRGTPSVTDDIVLRKGQTWVSLTSASEGTSYVTVVAARGENWPQRRQTATIYWVDAQWSMPNPTSARAGQPHVLTTTVTRTGTAAPVANWIVRYQVTGGVPATLGPNAATAVEVRTDADGRASVPLNPAGTDPGTTQVRIQIIRPADLNGETPRTKLGEGYTSVTWSAPGLVLRATGPQAGAVDATLVYRVEVYNPGDVTTHAVVLRDTLPPGWRLISSSPPARIFGDRAEWRLGDLAPKTTQVVEVSVRPGTGGNARYRFEATSQEQLTAAAFVDTQVTQPSLKLDVAGPETATVGAKIQFRVQVTNAGQQTLDNVVITDRFDTGLQHAEGQTSPIQREIGRLEPGETRQIAVTFLVRRAGQICHTLEVSAPGGQFAQQQACLRAIQPRPSPQPRLSVSKTGPAEVRVGQSATFTIRVTNTGNVPLTQVRIADSYAAALTPEKSTPGLDPRAAAQQQIAWIVATLPPGAVEVRQVQCVAGRETPLVGNPVVVSAAENVRETADAQIRVLPATPATGPPTPGAGVVPPSIPKRPAVTAGNLKVDISEFGDPVSIGEITTYLITVKNDRAVSDRNVRIILQFPQGLKFNKLSGPVNVLRTSADGRTVEVTPIREMRAQESLRPFQVEAIGRQAGDQKLTVKVVSERSPDGVVATETTTVSQG